MLRTRILIGCGLVYCGALWAGGTALGRLIACLACGCPAAALRFGSIFVACAAIVVVATVVFVRTFRAEVRAREALWAKSRDRRAPPWAEQ